MKTIKRLRLLKGETTAGSRVRRAVEKTSCPLCGRNELEVILPDHLRIGERRRSVCMTATATLDTKIILCHRQKHTIVCSSYRCNSNWMMQAGDRLTQSPSAYMRLLRKVRPVMGIPFSS